MSEEPIDEEVLAAYVKPMLDYLRAKWEREANEWDQQMADLINEQLKP